MNPIKHPSESQSIDKPIDWIEDLDGSCGYLSVYDQVDARTGSNMMHSWWRPNVDERALIAAGAAIELRVYGRIHPVVSLALAPFRKKTT